MTDTADVSSIDNNEPTVKKVKLSTDERIKVDTIETENRNLELHETKIDELKDNACESGLSENKQNEPGPSENKNNELGSSDNKINKSLVVNVEINDDEDSSNDEELEIGFTYSIDLDASDMLFETDFDGILPSVTERYFTPYYQIDTVKPGDDVCIRVHSNRICMISLAPGHTIFQENKTIVNCNFKVSEKLDRLQNKVSGKAKHGAQPMQSNSNLCCLTCDDDSKYMVKCCMIGKLVEVNESLVEDPELLKKEPHHGGYIAIVLPNLKHLDRIKDKLLTQEQYEEAIKKRKEKKNEIEDETKKITIEKESNVTLDTHAFVNKQNNQVTEKEKKIEICDNIEIVKEKQNQEQSNNTNTATDKEQAVEKDISMEIELYNT